MTAPEQAPARAGELVEIRIGRRRADGSIRYVVVPIQWTWVGGMAAVSLGLAVLLFVSSADAPWYAGLIWVVLPLGFIIEDGFDLRPREQEIRVWRSLCFVPYATFTLRHAKMPEVRSSMETRSTDHGESRARVTRLWWGSRNLRVRLDRAALSELLAEARRAAEAGRDGRR